MDPHSLHLIDTCVQAVETPQGEQEFHTVALHQEVGLPDSLSSNLALTRIRLVSLGQPRWPPDPHLPCCRGGVITWTVLRLLISPDVPRWRGAVTGATGASLWGS